MDQPIPRRGPSSRPRRRRWGTGISAKAARLRLRPAGRKLRPPRPPATRRRRRRARKRRSRRSSARGTPCAPSREPSPPGPPGRCASALTTTPPLPARRNALCARPSAASCSAKATSSRRLRRQRTSRFSPFLECGATCRGRRCAVWPPSSLRSAGTPPPPSWHAATSGKTRCGPRCARTPNGCSRAPCKR